MSCAARAGAASAPARAPHATAYAADVPEYPPSAGRRADGAALGASATSGRRRDAELVQACVAGDERAWRELVERYGSLVYAVSRRLGLPDDLADDAFQETFTILLRQLPRLERPEALVNWLTTTARRVGMGLADRNRRHVGHVGHVGHDGHDRHGQHADPRSTLEVVDDPTLERFEVVHRVQLALDSLGGRCRDLLLALTRSARPSYSAIAEELHMPVGSIGPTRARCLARLMELLGPDDGSLGGSST